MNKNKIRKDIYFINEILKKMNISKENKEIVLNVLVRGESQLDQVRKYNKTAAAISQLMKRVSKVARMRDKEIIPPGHKKIIIIVPEFTAYQLTKKYTELKDGD